MKESDTFIKKSQIIRKKFILNVSVSSVCVV